MANQEVLIVDDDMVTRLILRKMFNAKEIVTHEAENGKQALDVLEKQSNISCVVLDLNMPVMDGYSFIEHLSTESLHEEVKIYIMSGNPQTSFKAKMNDRNVDINRVIDYYQKPCTMTDLVERINIVVQQS